MAAACALPSGVDGIGKVDRRLRQRQSGPRAQSRSRTWRAGRSVSPNFLMKSRRVVSPRSQASTSCGEAGLEITPFAIVHCASSLPVDIAGCRSATGVLFERRCPASLRPVHSRLSGRSPSGPVHLPAQLPKRCGEICKTLLPNRRCRARLVDDAARLAAVLDLEHRLDVGGAVAGKALVGPAKRMRRQDDIVELEDRIVEDRAAPVRAHRGRRRRSCAPARLR